MNNIEQTPSVVFDWMKTKAFGQLNAQEQQTVERYMSRAEYDEMHDATQLVSAMVDPAANRRGQIKAGLLERFDSKHQPKKLTLTLSSQLLWKVAAVFLAIGLPVSAYILIKSNKQLISNQLNGRVDTVYLENALTSNPLKVYDTVYIVKETEVQRTKKYKQQKELLPNPVDEVEVLMQTDLNIQSIKDVNSAPNTRKRNAIKDDSLINHYNFVTL